MPSGKEKQIGHAALELPITSEGRLGLAIPNL